MMGKALVDIFIDDSTNTLRRVFDLLGTPLVALLIAVIVAMFTLGRGSGMDARLIAKTVDSSLPADRRHPADRLRRRRLQAGAGRHRHRHPAGRLGPRRQRLGAAARLGARRADPPRDRLRHGRHDHRLVADDRAGRGPAVGRGLAGRARGRRGLGVLQPRQRRRVLAGQGVLRALGRPDHQDLVADGDRALRHRAWSSCCCSGSSSSETARAGPARSGWSARGRVPCRHRGWRRSPPGGPATGGRRRHPPSSPRRAPAPAGRRGSGRPAPGPARGRATWGSAAAAEARWASQRSSHGSAAAPRTTATTVPRVVARGGSRTRSSSTRHPATSSARPCSSRVTAAGGPLVHTDTTARTGRSKHCRCRAVGSSRSSCRRRTPAASEACVEPGVPQRPTEPGRQTARPTGRTPASTRSWSVDCRSAGQGVPSGFRLRAPSGRPPGSARRWRPS